MIKNIIISALISLEILQLPIWTDGYVIDYVMAFVCLAWLSFVIITTIEDYYDDYVYKKNQTNRKITYDIDEKKIIEEE